jgi:hypothetical protein
VGNYAVCRGCRQYCPRNLFSANQWKMRPGKQDFPRKCANCLSETTATQPRIQRSPPSAHEAIAPTQSSNSASQSYIAQASDVLHGLWVEPSDSELTDSQCGRMQQSKDSTNFVPRGAHRVQAIARLRPSLSEGGTSTAVATGTGRLNQTGRASDKGLERGKSVLEKREVRLDQVNVGGEVEIKLTFWSVS